MKLYQYDDIKKLNQALGSFGKNSVPVGKVELAVVEGKIQYFVLADPKDPILKTLKAESKTEEQAKKLIKEKKVEKDEKTEK